MMNTAHYTTHSSRSSSSRPPRPSDTFRPRGRLPLDPFAAPAHAASYSSYNGSSYSSSHQSHSSYQNNAHASSSSSAASSPTRATQHPNSSVNVHPQRRDSGSSTGSGSAYTYEGVEQGQGQGYAQGAMWRVPRALVYGYDERERERRGGRGQVVLVLGDPPAAELLPLLSSPHLADPTTALVLIATSSPPVYLLRQSAASGHDGPGSSSGSGPGPAIRILRLAEPLDAHQGGALRLVSLFERAGRVVDAWRAGSGYRKGTGKDADKRSGKGSYYVGGERIVQLAEDASGEFVCVEAYRPAPDPSGSVSKGALRTRYPSPPSEEGRPVTRNGVEQAKKKRFRFSMSMGSGSPGGVNGSDSPRPLMESRMPTSSPPASPLSSSFSKATTSPKSRSPAPAPVSPYASRRLSQSSFSLSSSSAAAFGTTATTMGGQAADGRTFDAIVNFLPVQAPDKALLKHAILVSTLGAQYLGVGGQASASLSSGMAGPANPNIMTMPTSKERERNEGGAKLRKRPSRRLSMTQRLSGFFGMGGAGGDEKALKELREMAEKTEKEKEKQKQTNILSANAVPIHAHVVHILPPNMGNAQERPHGHKLVQGIEQFLLTFAYPLGSMLGGTGGRNSTYRYGYAGSSGSLSSLTSLGSVGVQLNNMGMNMGGGTRSAFSSAPSSRNSSSSSLSAMGNVQHPHAPVYANSSQTLSQSQATGPAPVQAQVQVQPQHPRSRSLFSIGSPGGSRPASYLDGPSGKESDNGVVQKIHKPTTPPSAYPAPHMQRQRVRSSGASSTPHRPASMYSTSTYGHANTNNGQASGVLGSGSGTLAQLAAQMAGRPVPYLVAPGVFGAPIGAVGSTRASGSRGARRMTYGEAILMGVLDWDSGVEGGVGAGMCGAGRAYVAWGDVVCDGEVEGEDAVEEEHVESTESPAASGPAGTVKKRAIESTPRPAPTTTQLPTPPESSASSAESSVEGGDVESEAASVGNERHDSDKTPQFSSMPRFTRSPSSARSGGSSVASGTRATPVTEAATLTSLPHDPLLKLPRTAEPAAGLARGTEANGTSAAGKDRGTETEEAATIGDPFPLASNSPPSALTSLPSLSVQERRRNHRPAPPPPSTPSPLFASMVAETQTNQKQTKTPALPEMVRNDPLRMSVSAAPTVSPALTKAVGGIEMDRSHDQSCSQEGDVPFFSAASSAPAAEPPMMITLTSATVASVNRGQSQSEAVPPPVTTNSSDSGYGSTESARAHEAHATPLSHKAARPLHVSSTANPDLPEETQKAVQDAVAKLVGESEAETAADGRLSRRRSSSLKGKANRRSQSKTRSPASPKASPAVPQQPGQQSPAGNAKRVGKDVGSEVGKNGKLQGAWRKLGSWRRNDASSPAVDSGASPSV